MWVTNLQTLCFSLLALISLSPCFYCCCLSVVRALSSWGAFFVSLPPCLIKTTNSASWLRARAPWILSGRPFGKCFLEVFSASALCPAPGALSFVVLFSSNGQSSSSLKRDRLQCCECCSSSNTLAVPSTLKMITTLFCCQRHFASDGV